MGLSAEPKNVLKLCDKFQRFDLQNERDFDKAIKLCLESTVFKHLETRIGLVISDEELRNHISEKSVEGFIIGMFRYVAELRMRYYPKNKPIINKPGWKDPKDLINLKKIRNYLSGLYVINMIRNGENVAYSVTKLDWGATNPVAGAYEWKNAMKILINQRDLFNDGSYLEIKLEDINNELSDISNKIDNFFVKNIGRSNLSGLRLILSDNYKNKKIREYDKKGIQYRLVKYLVSETNYELGYSEYGYQKSNYFYDLLVFFYILLDFPIRIKNRISRFIKSKYL